MREIVRRPPTREAPLGIELRPLVVEAVADLMADDRADRAEVRRRRRARVEVGRRQNPRGEIDRVADRHVHGVDHLRQHRPRAAIDRLAELGDAPAILERLGALGVADGVAPHDRQTSVVAPRVGVPDADAQRGELLLGLRLRRRRHPAEGVDAAAWNRPSIAVTIVSICRLIFGGEPAKDVQPADRVAERVVGRVERAPPARSTRDHSAELTPEERELLVAERLRQDGRFVLDRTEREVLLPRVERLARDERRDSRDGVSGCQTTKVVGASSRAAAKNAPQSNPGARVANSLRGHGLFAFAMSSESTRGACACAIFVSSRTMRSAFASASATPASVSIAETCRRYFPTSAVVRADVST